ncbi:2-oxoacid:ferredoxin oxidoreductase subunit beta [candidate division FCPU426 bacterium]|nr:2-oxoacid:ferredoxin oxidoreductase subunit beta [candidate division FCPU426 bacterium]
MPGDYKTHNEIAWCPGCGNFGIANALQQALAAMALNPKDVLLVSGIGQAAKLPHYIKANCFNGLHGRALPVAAGAKIANRKLTVLVTTGDGDCYGEGGNHFIHAIRRNLDITVMVHDNQIYGLTKGQASPTTDPGYVTKVQTHGALLEPMHPLAVAMALGAGFVARGYSKDVKHLADLIQAGVQYKGFALIDVLQPCISFNKKNTYQWYDERVYTLDASYDAGNEAGAYQKAREWGDKIPLGVIYQKASFTYEEKTGLAGRAPLVEMDIDSIDVGAPVKAFQVDAEEE